MARTDKEVVDILLKLYDAEFGGKRGQRYLLSWGDLRSLYGFGRLFQPRFSQLEEAASKKSLCLKDLGEGERGHLVAVIKAATVDRWRRVPKRIIETYELAPDDLDEAFEHDVE